MLEQIIVGLWIATALIAVLGIVALFYLTGGHPLSAFKGWRGVLHEKRVEARLQQAVSAFYEGKVTRDDFRQQMINLQRKENKGEEPTRAQLRRIDKAIVFHEQQARTQSVRSRSKHA
jgi:hypothetical protein